MYELASSPSREGKGAEMGQPLEGIRVLDVGTRVSAPFCAGLLGEMGADVVKVEAPGIGDFMRALPPLVDDYSLSWSVEGRGRRSVTLDLRQAAGQDLFRRLAATADIVCENFRPGTMERWHVGPADCSEQIIWVRISVFGQDGPNSHRPGLDRLGIAYGGLLHLSGYPDRPPVRPGVFVSDYLTGAMAASAALAGLFDRDRGGGGRVVDAALYGSILRILEWTIAGYDRLGIVRGREGNRLSNAAPLDNYPTSDGKFVCIVGSSNTNFARLCAAMGRMDLLDDPRWASPSSRVAGSDEINAIVTAWTSGLTAAEVEAACIDHDVPVGMAYTVEDILADAHMAYRGDVVTVDDVRLGPIRQQAPYPRFDGQRPVAPASAPELGAHNRQIWQDELGLTDAELDELRAAAVI
jgi:crotonobetainyl-CoA:carnitine CoA-transferase CaiB-like acyl-CoA transferase